MQFVDRQIFLSSFLRVFMDWTAGSQVVVLQECAVS